MSVNTADFAFAGQPDRIDRATYLRPAAGELLGRGRALLWPFWREKPLFDTSGAAPAPGWVPPLENYMEKVPDGAVFLGMLDGRYGAPCFAADFSELEEDEVNEMFDDGVKFIDLRSIATELAPHSATLAAMAKGALSWHAANRFCARCGEPSTQEDGGWRRRCGSCSGLNFPRTDPVAIMLVVHEDNALLGRQSEWPKGIHSLLAGFVEPGETVEDAVRRETREEAGVEVGQVRYLASQPWPFPSSLMLGCVAEAQGTELVIDRDELESAHWVSREDMAKILEGKHRRFAPPRKDAIAYAMLTAWVAGEIEGF